ncbi:MAG: hypothetical protein R2731_01985 [Nocardioides sp.]
MTVRRLGEPVRADLLVSTILALPQEGLVDSLAEVGAVFEVLCHPGPPRWPAGPTGGPGDRPRPAGTAAALQFELFTAPAAPLEAMRDAGRAALAAQRTAEGPDLGR